MEWGKCVVGEEKCLGVECVCELEWLWIDNQLQWYYLDSSHWGKCISVNCTKLGWWTDHHISKK